MSAQQIDPDDELPDDLDDLLDDLPAKKGARPLVRTPEQTAKNSIVAAQAASAQQAAMLAQIVNLHIAGFSLAQIGAQIGASADEVDRMLSNEAARYVRNQPALRTYVRNYVSGKYTALLEAVWDEATDKTHREKLEHQDRALRILDKMAKLHGADAPTQAEVKVDAAPEAVEKLVAALAAGSGLGYNTDIFDDDDIVDAEVVHEAVTQSAAALEVSGNAVEVPTPEDKDL
jgi:hypothetical protein